MVLSLGPLGALGQIQAFWGISVGSRWGPKTTCTTHPRFEPVIYFVISLFVQFGLKCIRNVKYGPFGVLGQIWTAWGLSAGDLERPKISYTTLPPL